MMSWFCGASRIDVPTELMQISGTLPMPIGSRITHAPRSSTNGSRLIAAKTSSKLPNDQITVGQSCYRWSQGRAAVLAFSLGRRARSANAVMEISGRGPPREANGLFPFGCSALISGAQWRNPLITRAALLFVNLRHDLGWRLSRSEPRAASAKSIASAARLVELYCRANPRRQSCPAELSA